MTHTALPRERLYQELQRPTAQVSLARGALYIAQEDYPHLVVDDYLAMLDRMAETLRQRLPQDRYPLKIIVAINDYLLGINADLESSDPGEH